MLLGDGFDSSHIGFSGIGVAVEKGYEAMKVSRMPNSIHPHRVQYRHYRYLDTKVPKVHLDIAIKREKASLVVVVVILVVVILVVVILVVVVVRACACACLCNSNNNRCPHCFSIVCVCGCFV